MACEHVLPRGQDRTKLAAQPFFVVSVVPLW
jgi:hypothetical protein